MIQLMRGILVLAASMTILTGRASQLPSEYNQDFAGRVNIEGTILASACDIDIGDRWQTVAMGTETRTNMLRLGKGKPQPFTITLRNCALATHDATENQGIKVTFEGDEERGLFRVNGMASGVVLELMDHNGAVIVPGRSVTYQQTSTDTPNFNYWLTLKTNQQDLQVGSYHAQIRYRIEYY